MVKEFFTYHFEEIEEEMNAELEKADKSLPEEDQWLSLLQVRRIGFYFSEDNFATWDFMFNPDFTDQILVVVTDKNGEIDDISWES